MAHRHLTVESLERRLLLAGDVTAATKSGWLVVTGDEAGNQVQITDLGGGTYGVAGTGTTINGADAVYVGAGVTKGIKVDLKKGDDQLQIVGDPNPFLVAGDVVIQMGDGEDSVTLKNAGIGGKATIDLGKGTAGNWDEDRPGLWIDEVQFGKDVSVKAGDAPGVEEPIVWIDISRSTVAGNLAVTTGKTDDDIWLEGITVTKNVTIKTSDGMDFVGIAGWEDDEWEPSSAPSLLRANAAAAEAVLVDEVVRSQIDGKLSIDIGKSGGGIWLAQSTIKQDVSFNAGDEGGWELGNWAEAWDATIEGKLTIKLGKGTSEVWLSGVTVNKDVSVTTNNGDDYIVFEADSEEPDAEGEGEFVPGNVFGGKVTVNTGSGSDMVDIASSEVTGALGVNTGSGGDSVAIVSSQVTGALDVDTGNDADMVGLFQVDAKSTVSINSGNATAEEGDQVLVTDSKAASLSVTTGNGADSVGIGKSAAIDAALAAFLEEVWWGEGLDFAAAPVEVLGKLTVKAGSGNDTELSIGQCQIGGSASFDAGSGNDTCEILDTTIGAGASVKMGTGNDGLKIGKTTVTGKATLDGGSGADGVLDLGGNVFGELVVKGIP